MEGLRCSTRRIRHLQYRYPTYTWETAPPPSADFSKPYVGAGCQAGLVWRRLTTRAEWRFFAVLPKADPRLAVAWWLLLVARGVLPAGFAVATG